MTTASSPPAALARRHLLRRTGALVLIGAAATLSACGFRLRQAPDFAFQTIALEAAASSALGQELHRQIEGSGQVRVVDVAQAQVRLRLLQDQRERVVVGVNAAGEVREVTLRVRARMSLLGRDGLELLPEAEFLREMDMSYSETGALAHEMQADMLYRSMQGDIVQQMLRQLATVRDPSL